MKIAVLGAGISGLSIAQMLRNNHEVTLFEINESIGGLIKCDRVNDCLYHKVGGHVFNSKNEIVLKWFWSFFDRDNEFTKVNRNAKVYFKNKIIGYPIENHIYTFHKQLAAKIITELMILNNEKTDTIDNHSDFETFLKKSFGETLYEIYFKPYNKKIWNTDLTKVSLQWLEGKLPMPDYHEILLSNILREEESNMVHATFFYPKYNGSQFLVDRLSNNLNIEKNFKLIKADFTNGQITLNNDRKFDKVIYTGDVRNLPLTWERLLESNNINTKEIRSLQSNGTSTLFCETDETDISWLYIPEEFTRAHRIIYTGNFSSTNNSGTARITCVVEFSGKLTYDEMVAEITLLPGNLTPISFNYEPNSYIIQSHNTRKIISATKNVLENHGIYLLGRFAEWEYYNMDKAVEAAFYLRDRIADVTDQNIN